MAQPGGSSLSGLSLTGTLTLQHKSKSFFKGVKSHFFWFDEQNCSLKYYRGREASALKVNEPLGFIDLRCAKVTPGITNGYNNKQFLISVNQQVYVLTASSEQEALNWIEKLQEKRGEYIKMSSAMSDSAQEQEKERKALRPFNSQPGSVLNTNDVSSSPPSVRKIFNSKLMGTGSPERHSMNIDYLIGSSPPTPISTPLEHDTTPMDPMKRKYLELETQYLEARRDMDLMRKEMMKLTCHLEEKERLEQKLYGEIATLKEELIKINKPQCDLALENESLKDVIEQYKRSLKSLDEEINLHTLNQNDHDRRVAVERMRVDEAERELLAVKAKYIKLFSDKFKPTIQGVGDEDDIGEETANAELVMLLEQEGGDHPELKTYRESFEDQYGDSHDWTSGVTTQLYLCRQLYLHYTFQDSERVTNEWEKYLSNVKIAKKKQYLELPPPFSDRTKKRELRNMLRRGLPLQYRTKVWSSLIQKVIGHVRELRDSSAGKGLTYYQSLLNAKTQSPSSKQIGLDLYRTLPSNVHFQRGGNGAQKLENVLLAYSLHNKNVSYCQGMNMVAAIGLLFLDEETDFWFMVAIIDKLMPQHYFSPGLLGAQADQAVIRELVASKLPLLHAHLQRYNIDVTLVTFNWFLTLFVDALPTETVVRILDCFLMEGAKILFRMSLGILKINERKILSLTDPVALFQFLKEVARHTYDIEAVFHAAFVDLEPFPSRAHLQSRHHTHFSEVKEQWNERERQRAVHATPVPSRNVRSLPAAPERRRLVWETGCVRKEEVWMACTENDAIHLSIISDRLSTEVPLPQVSSRVICMLYLPLIDLIVLGTLDFHLHAVNCSTQNHLWSMKLNDSVLSLAGDDSLYTALADGSVAVVQNISEAFPCDDPLHVRIGNSSTQCLALNSSKSELWCGCGKAVTVISTQTLEVVQSVVIPDGVGKVYKMELGSHGLWVSFKNSSAVSLYDLDCYVQLLHVDYSSLLPSSGDKALEYRVTSLMVHKEQLWLGAGSGNLFLFSVAAAVPNPTHKIKLLALKQSGSQPDSQFRARVGSGGLLSSVTVEDSPDLSYLERRRKTMFGATLKGGARKNGHSADVYKLVFRDLVPSPMKEATRTLLYCPSEDCVLSSVNTAESWQEGVQFWTRDSTTDQWVYQYLKTASTSSQD